MGLKLFSRVKKQNGFTMVELLIAMAITVIIGTALVMTVTQLFSVSIGDSNHMEAVKQVESALHYINRDAQMAKSEQVVVGSSLQLTWDDYTSGSKKTNQVTYSLVDGNLQRAHNL